MMIENDAGKSGVGILVKEELCDSVVEICRSDRMMTICLILEKMIRVIRMCLCTPKWKARYTKR